MLPFGLPAQADMSKPLCEMLDFIGKHFDKRHCVVVATPPLLSKLQDDNPANFGMLPTCFQQVNATGKFKIVASFHGVPAAEAIGAPEDTVAVLVRERVVGGLSTEDAGATWFGWINAGELSYAAFEVSEPEPCANPNHVAMTIEESFARDEFADLIRHCRAIDSIASPARIIGLFIAALVDVVDMEPEETARLLVWSSVAPDVGDDDMLALMKASLTVRAKSKADGTW